MSADSGLTDEEKETVELARNDGANWGMPEMIDRLSAQLGRTQQAWEAAEDAWRERVRLLQVQLAEAKAEIALLNAATQRFVNRYRPWICDTPPYIEACGRCAPCFAREIARLKGAHGVEAGINICPTRYDYSSLAAERCAEGGCVACIGELRRVKGGG